MKKFSLKLIRNKRNGSVAIQIPKRKLPKKYRDDLFKFERANIFLDNFE